MGDMDDMARHPLPLTLLYMLLAVYLAYGMLVVWRDAVDGILADKDGYLFFILHTGRVLAGCCRAYWALCYSLFVWLFLTAAARGLTWVWCRFTGQHMARPVPSARLPGIVCGVLSWAGTACLAAGSALGMHSLLDSTFGDVNGAGPVVGMFTVPFLFAACLGACIISVFWSLAVPFLVRKAAGWTCEMAGGTAWEGGGHG